MKLLFCDECYDLFKLHFEIRSCHCGKVSGYYKENGGDAVVNGKGTSLAIGNGSLAKALYNVMAMPEGNRDAFLKDNRIICWARPHEGEGNPRTTVADFEE